MPNANKNKGSKWERDLVEYFRSRGYLKVQRRYGAGAQHDTGDLSGINDVVIEAKDCKKITLSTFMDETKVETENAKADFGVCIIKRARKPVSQAYVVVPLEDFVTLLANANYK